MKACGITVLVKEEGTTLTEFSKPDQGRVVLEGSGVRVHERYLEAIDGHEYRIQIHVGGDVPEEAIAVFCVLTIDGQRVASGDQDIGAGELVCGQLRFPAPGIQCFGRPFQFKEITLGE